jgi:hypothetical protein
MPSNLQNKPPDKITRIKRSLAQSDYITSTWNWFMILAGKAAEPVLVASVLYASVKLLPTVHFPPQYDVAVFIAQFVALDIGGLSLNKLADQAKKDGNEDGATHAKRLSIALVSVMLVGVIMAGVGQVVKLDGQVGTVIDTILLIARAVLAVLYSRVIHSLKKDDDPPSEEQLEELVTEKVNTVLAAMLTTMQQKVVLQFQATLSQQLEERLTMLDRKQAELIVQLQDEQAKVIHEIIETVRGMVETALQERANVSPVPVSSPKVRSITEAASRKQATGGTGGREIDKIVWPLLDAGLSTRVIASQANTSTATVGRSRKRWVTANAHVSTSRSETATQPAMLADYETDGGTEERAL